MLEKLLSQIDKDWSKLAAISYSLFSDTLKIVPLIGTYIVLMLDAKLLLAVFSPDAVFRLQVSSYATFFGLMCFAMVKIGIDLFCPEQPQFVRSREVFVSHFASSKSTVFTRSHYRKALGTLGSEFKNELDARKLNPINEGINDDAVIGYFDYYFGRVVKTLPNLRKLLFLLFLVGVFLLAVPVLILVARIVYRFWGFL